MNSIETITQEIIAWMAKTLLLETSEIDPSQTFMAYGLDSMEAVQLADHLQHTFDVEVSTELAYEYPIIQELAAHVAQQATQEPSGG